MWTVGLGLLMGIGASKLVERLSTPAGDSGFADHLLWGLPVATEPALLNVDGSLTCGFELRGPDYMSCTETELVEIGRTVNGAFMRLEDHWLLHFDVARLPAPDYPPSGAFPDPATSLLDEERRARFGADGHNLISRQVLVVTFRPPPSVYQRSGSWFVDEPGPTQSEPWRRSYEQFRSEVERLERALARVFEMDRLTIEDLAAHLRFCLTGHLQPVSVPTAGLALRDLLAAEDFIGGFKPRIGSEELRVVAVTGFPVAPRLDAFEIFHSVPFPCRSSHRIYPLGREVGLSILGRQRLLWFNKGGGLGKKSTAEVFSDSHAGAMASDASAAMAEISSESTRYAAYTWTLIVTDPTPERVEEKARDLVERFAARGFAASVETLNATAAYFGSLPAHGGHNLRKPLIGLRNIADLLGTTTPHLGAANCPSSLYPPGSPPILWALTEETTPYRLHLVHEDVPHGLILGMTRAGKSVLVGLLALQGLRWPESQVFVFDVDYSSAFLTLAANGEHYDLGGDGADVHFQPLAEIDHQGELEWALGWLEQLLQLQGQVVGAAWARDLEQGLRLLASEPREHRTLSLLKSYCQESPVKEALRPYTREGAYGTLLDASYDGLQNGRFQVFEMTHLLRSRGGSISIPVLLYLFHRIERRLEHGHPSLIVIEEAWLPLLDPRFAAQIESWLRRLAKLNGGVWLVTQSAGEVLAAEHAKVILDSCSSRIYLPDPHAGEAGSRELYQSLGLNDREIGLLASAEARRHYLHSSPRGSRLIELALGPYALVLLTPAPGKTVLQMHELARSLRGEHGSAWFGEYLEHRGLREWAQRFRAASDKGAVA